MRRRHQLGIFILLLAVMTAAAAAPPEEPALPFTPDELARLERGEVVLRHVEKELSPDQVASRLVGAVWVRHPPEVIWEVLNHPEREVEWIPGVKQSRVVSVTCPTPTTRTNVTDYRIGAFGIEVYYSLVREYDYAAGTIKAHQDPNRPHRLFEDVQAGWDFYPFRDGIIFQYWSDSRLTFELPSFLTEAMAERTVTAGVEAVAKRCDEIAREMKQRGAAPGPALCPEPEPRPSDAPAD